MFINVWDQFDLLEYFGIVPLFESSVMAVKKGEQAFFPGVDPGPVQTTMCLKVLAFKVLLKPMFWACQL